MLWKLYSEYILCDNSLGLSIKLRSLALSSSREQKVERMETRMMSFDTLWAVLRDFEIAPDICNKNIVQESVQYVQFIMGSSRSSSLKVWDVKRVNNATMDSLNNTWSTIDDGQEFGTSLGNTGGSNVSEKSRNSAASDRYDDPEYERISFSEFLKVLFIIITVIIIVIIFIIITVIIIVYINVLSHMN